MDSMKIYEVYRCRQMYIVHHGAKMCEVELETATLAGMVGGFLGGLSAT